VLEEEGWLHGVVVDAVAVVPVSLGLVEAGVGSVTGAGPVGEAPAVTPSSAGVR
jgi:hypothetical protein